MGTLREAVEQWAELMFTENPYGEPIPEKYLYDQRVMRERSDGVPRKPLAHRKQDGNVLNSLFNDPTKQTPAEKEETISFSAVFHRLERAGTLCPSNFIVEVINDLQQWDGENNTRHDDDFYCKTIARALRTFASMLREQNLREIVNQVLKIEAIRRRNGYKMFEPSVEEDMLQKTDIALKYAGAFYRIWSYQSTEAGIDRTSKRIIKGAGRGRNLLMPFDIATVGKFNGWALYDEAAVKEVLMNLVVTNKSPIQSYSAYRKLVIADPAIIAEPAIFDAA